MQHKTFKLLMYATSVAFWLGLYYVGFPIWGIVFTLPLFGYIQLYTANQFSFRDSLRLEPIPDSGYEVRISRLYSSQLRFEELGFEKVDELYMRTSTDAVVYVYKHESLPITLADVDLEAARFTDLITRFENGASLTTTTAPNVGVVLPLEHQIVHAAGDNGPTNLLESHIENIEFVRDRGFRYSQLQSETFRQHLLKNFLAQGQWIRGPFAPALMIYRMYFKKNLSFRLSIRDQVNSGALTLPN